GLNAVSRGFNDFGCVGARETRLLLRHFGLDFLAGENEGNEDGFTGTFFVPRKTGQSVAAINQLVDREKQVLILNQRSERTASGSAGSPRPLEVESAEMPGYIHDFADEVQSRNRAALHAPGGEFVGVHAAGGHFSLLVSFG